MFPLYLLTQEKWFEREFFSEKAGDALLFHLSLCWLFLSYVWFINHTVDAPVRTLPVTRESRQHEQTRSCILSFLRMRFLTSDKESDNRCDLRTFKLRKKTSMSGICRCIALLRRLLWEPASQGWIIEREDVRLKESRTFLTIGSTWRNTDLRLTELD